MNIVVVGSTGRTGMEIVSQALERDHQVAAWARTPAKMTIDHPKLTTHQVDILQTPLTPELEGVDAVIVALGGAQLKDTSTRSVGTRRLVEAMQQSGVPRIVIVSSAGVGDSLNQLDAQGQYVVETIIKDAVEDHGRQEDLTKQSELQWTIVRPGGLTTDPFIEYTADPSGTIRISSIPRACVADFTLNALDDDATIEKTYTLRAE